MADNATTPVNVLSWDDVKNSDAFQKLSGEQQEAARNQYFAQVVAPRVPASALAEVRQLFDDDTGPGLKNWSKDILRSAVTGLSDFKDTMDAGATGAATGRSVMLDGVKPDNRQNIAATNGLAPLSKLGQDRIQEAAAIAPEAASSMAAREGVIGDAAKLAVAEQQRRLDARAAGLPQAAVPTTPAEMGINAATSVIGQQNAEIEKRRQFAEDNPHLAALASGQASFAQGALDAVPWAADTINAPINKALAAAGIDYQLPNAPRMPGAQYLQDASRQYRTKAMDMTFDQMKTPEDFDNWLTQSLASQLPQVAGSTAAAFLPKLRAAWLGIMGATTTGQKYQENKERGLDGDVARGEAAVSGAIEVLSEMLPLHVFDKISGLIKRLPLEAQLGVLGRTISKTAAATGALAAQGVTGAIEESVAQLGQNASDRYLAGNTKITDLTQGVPEAAVLGAAMEGPMGIGHVANAFSTPEHSAAGFAEAFRRMVNDAKWEQPLDGKYDRPENTAPGAIDWTRQREVKADAAVPPAAEAKAATAAPKQDTTGAIPAEQLLGAEVPDGQTPTAAPTAAVPAAEAPAAEAKKPTFDLGKLDRQQTTGPLTGTPAGPEFTAEDVLPKDKPFDVTLAANRAYNDHENAKIKDAWNQAHFTTDADGNTQRIQHDHFETWHQSGGVTMDVGSQFDAHGIAKTNPLGALLNLLQNGVNTSRRFDTAALVASNNPRAAGGAYKDGPFIVLGEAGKSIADGGIKSVLVSDAVANVIQPLQERFPNIDFIPYSQAQAKLSEKVAATTQPASQGEQDGQGQEGRRQEVLTGDGASNPTGGTVAGGTTEGTTGEQQGGTQTPQTEQGQPQETGQDTGSTATPVNEPAAPTGDAPTAPTGDAPAGGAPAAPTGGTPAGGAAQPKKPRQPKEPKAEGETPTPEGEATPKEPKQPKQPKAEPAPEERNPVAEAVTNGDGQSLADIIYEGIKAVEDLDVPIVISEDRMARFSVDPKYKDAVEVALKKNKFRVTDRTVSAKSDDPSAAGSERISITALYNPDKTGLGDAGEAFVNNRKEENKPKLEKDPTDKQIDAMLDALKPENLIDIELDGQSFGAFMFKEAMLENMLRPSEYIGRVLIAKYGFSDRIGVKQAIKRVAQDYGIDKINALADHYRTRAIKLHETMAPHTTVNALAEGLRAAYLENGSVNEDGVALSRVMKNRDIAKLISKYQKDFENEHSTDQTNRVKKKDADKAPAIPLEQIVRRGMGDHRGGRDVDENDFLTTFGFAGLSFGNWVNQEERQTSLNMVFDSLHDMADTLGLNPKVLGLNGKLKLAIGAQGRGGSTAAWFVPGANEINLTKTKGDGTVGHEWQHGLDTNVRYSLPGRKLMDDMAEVLKNRVVSTEDVVRRLKAVLKDTAADTNNRNVPPKQALFNLFNSHSRWNSAEVYANWGAAASSDTQFARNARKMDDGASEKYWSKDAELLSRAFESMLFDATKGGTPYLVGPTRADGAMSPKNGYSGTPYPTGDEREYVSAMWKHMLQQIDPETLDVRTYTPKMKVVHVEGLGWTIHDQYGIGYQRDVSIHNQRDYALQFYKSEEDANAAANAYQGEQVYTPLAAEMAKVNLAMLDVLQNVDAIMDELGIIKWPEVKDGSMAESMFYHMRQGWWPKDNKALEDYTVKAFRMGLDVKRGTEVADAQKLDFVKRKQAQEDFEAAAARYLGQKITDMRGTGADDKAIFDYMVEMYKSMPNLNQRTNVSTANQAYSTPFPIAFVAGLLGRVTSSTTVLEPTAGNGLLALTANPKNVIAIELEQHRALNLRLMQIGKVSEGDATVELKKVRDQEADVVLTNPPFGALQSPVQIPSWDGRDYRIQKLDQQIAAEALRGMADNGRAVLILGANMKAGQITRNDRIFLNWLYTNYNVTAHFEVDGQLYKRMGAEWPLRVLVISGRNQTENYPANDIKVERVGSFDDLWSVYVQARDSSEQVVVGAGKVRPKTGGSDRQSGGVSAGSEGQDGSTGNADGQSGGDSQTDAGTGGNTSVTGGDGRGATGRRGSKPKHAGGNDGSGGGTGDSAAGGPGGSSGAGGESEGTDVAGVSGVTGNDIANWLSEVDAEDGKAKRQPRQRKESGGTKTTGGTKAKGETAEAPSAAGTVFEGADNALAELRRKMAEHKAKGQPAATDPNAIVEPSTPRKQYSRNGTDQSLYDQLLDNFEELWGVVKQKFKDAKSAAQQFYRDIKALLGKEFLPYVQQFLESKLLVKPQLSTKHPVKGENVDSEAQIVYAGRSQGDSDGVFVPRSQARHLYSALDAVESQYGDVDDFVQEELGYKSHDELYKALAGYQIDALALAFHNLKNNNGFIIGDDTGVGKGRTAAATIAWAVKNGKVPIFFSVTDSLYSDMYRDLVDIGFGDIKIGMTNTDSAIIDANNNTIYENKAKKRTGAELVNHIRSTGNLPDGVQALFTAYSQISDPKTSQARQEAIERLVLEGKAVLVMDEAHGAGGESNTNQFFMGLLAGENPPPVLYLSATFAKRPQNMPVYVRTNLRYAADTPSELVDMFKSGGDVLQGIASEMLTESGSMIRRERSYAGVQMDYFTDEANAPRDARLVDEVTDVLRAVVRADRAFNQWIKDQNVMAELIREYAPGTDMSTGKPMFDKIGKNPFTSIVHNYVGQLLLSAKIDTAVDHAVAALNRGEKPVIALQSTMESPLEDYVKANGLSTGDELPNFGWQSILERGMHSAHRVRFKSVTGNKKDDIVMEIPFDRMPSGIKAEFDKVQKLINGFNSPLLVSPVDAVSQKLGEYFVWEEDGQVKVGKEAPAGVSARQLKVAEVTGRNRGVDYRYDTPRLYNREDPGRRAVINGFQNKGGGIDVVILNSAGATGISLHAEVDKEGKPQHDQRPRRMIILQPNPDIAVFKQMLGRIHRTGQVEWPAFTVLATGIPAERRQMAVLKKKLSTMVSNTSAGSSAIGVDALDFVNRYGDIVTAAFLNEHDDIRGFLGYGYFDDPNKQEDTDLALEASGRAALLTVAEQGDYFDAVEEGYKQEIDMRNAAGTNKLLRREMPLEAEVLEEGLLEEGLDESNPFTRSALLAKMSVNVVGDVPTPKSVRETVEQSLGGKRPFEVVDAIAADLKVAYDEALNQRVLAKQEIEQQLAKPDLTDKERDDFEERLKAINNMIADFGNRREKTIEALTRQFPIGAGYHTFEVDDVEAKGVVIAVTYNKPKTKTGNPFAPSNFKVHIQRNIPGPRMPVPLSVLENASKAGIVIDGIDSRPDLEEWFQMRDVSGGRKDRYIATNNVLRARIALAGQGGEIVQFTYRGHTPETPRVGVGILMPDKFKPANLAARDYRFRSAASATDFVLNAYRALLADKYANTEMDSYKERLDAVESAIKIKADIPLEMVGNYATTLVMGASNGWLMSISRYYPNDGFVVSIDAKTHKNILSSKMAKDFWDSLGITLGKVKNARYYQANKGVKTPEDIAKVIKFLHQNSEVLAKNDFSEHASELSKAHFQAEEGGKGLNSRNGKTKGATVVKVSEWLAPAIAKMSNVDVRIVQSVNELPDDAAPSDVEGAWYSGMTVYLVADNLPSRRRAQGVLAHEAVGHAAMENMLGTHLMNNLVKEVNALGAAGNRTITALGKIVDKRQPGLDKNTRAREIVALMAENGVQHRVWRRIVQAVREWLRRQGFNIAFSDKDIDVLLRNAEKYAREGTPGAAAAGAAYSRRGGLLGYGQAQPDRKEGGLSDRILRAVGGDLLAKRVTMPIYNGIKHIALERDYGGTIGEYVDTIRAGVVSNYGLSEEYLDNKHDMTVGVNRVLREAMHITEQLKGLTRDESRIAYLWLNTKPEDENGGINQEEVALMAQLPQDSRALLAQVKNRIAELGQEAVNEGLLSQETYDANQMAYLHRDYAKHVFGDQRVQELSVMRTNAAKVIGEQFRKRGMFFQIAPEKVVGVTDVWHQNPLGQKLIRLEKKASTGRVMKRVWLPEGSPIPADMADFEQDAAAWQVRELKNGGYYLWRDFTEEERQQMGELDEAKYGVAVTMAQLAQDIESAKFFGWVADNYGEKEAPADAKVVKARDLTGAALDYADAVGKNVWVKVPDTQIDGTKLKKYGKLAGLYVPGPVWNDIRQIRHRPTPFGETYNKLMGMWKVAKTALSPMVHMNNVMANTFMADMHDVTPGDVVRAARFMYDWTRGDEATKKRNQDLWNRFEDSGATGGTFITSDLKTELLKPLLDQLEAEMNGGMGALDANVQVMAVVSLLFEKKWKQAMVSAMHTGAAKLPKKYIETLKWAYGSEDTFFRFAKFLQAVEMGMSDREAGKASREAFLDYEINAPWIQNLRHTALPFVAFSYRMIPMAIDVAANKPWKIAKYMALTNFLVWAAMMGGGVDEKEWKRIKKLLPDDKVGKTPFLTERMIPIGKDKHGRTIVLDITRWVPLGDVFELRGDSANMLPIWSPMYPAGPGMLVVELLMNKSAFTGDPIWTEADTIDEDGEDGITREMVGNIAGHVWKTMMPNHIGLPGVYATDKLMQAGWGGDGEGATDRFGRTQSVASALASSVGVKASPYDVESLQMNEYYKWKAADESAAVGMYRAASAMGQNKIGEAEFEKKMERLAAKREGLANRLSKKLDDEE